MHNISRSACALGKLLTLPARAAIKVAFNTASPQPNPELVAFFQARQQLQIKETARRALAATRALAVQLEEVRAAFGLADEDEVAEQLDCAVAAVNAAYGILKNGLPYQYTQQKTRRSHQFKTAQQELVEYQNLLGSLITAIDVPLDHEWLFVQAKSHVESAIDHLDRAWFEEEFASRFSEGG